MKLMVVDDDPASLDLVKALVEPLGYEVLALADSRQAAECVSEQEFDGIFVDVQMPNLDSKAYEAEAVDGSEDAADHPERPVQPVRTRRGELPWQAV